jgi:hypothetical protein
MTAPNIILASNINGTCTGKVLTTSTQDIVTVAANYTAKLNHVMVSNLSTATVTASVGLFDNVTTATYYFIYQTQIPANAAVDVINRSVYLKEGDKVVALASTNTVHITASWEIIS